MQISGQELDTVYYNLEGEVFIKELASFYRIAQYDTISGEIIGEFHDYIIDNDSLFAKGSLEYQEDSISIQYFEGDSIYLSISYKMSFLLASFIRIRDYPQLAKFIKPMKSIEERINHDTEYGEFIIVEEPAEFPGGMQTLGWFLGQFLTLPEEAIENDIHGKVQVQFIIEKDGSIKDPSILKGIGYGCDQEVLRVMKLIPDWLPGAQRGVPVQSTFVLPISF